MNRPRVDTDVPCLRARLWLAKKNRVRQPEGGRSDPGSFRNQHTGGIGDFRNRLCSPEPKLVGLQRTITDLLARNSCLNLLLLVTGVRRGVKWFVQIGFRYYSSLSVGLVGDRPETIGCLNQEGTDTRCLHDRSTTRDESKQVGEWTTGSGVANGIRTRNNKLHKLGLYH